MGRDRRDEHLEAGLAAARGQGWSGEGLRADALDSVDEAAEVEELSDEGHRLGLDALREPRGERHRQRLDGRLHDERRAQLGRLAADQKVPQPRIRLAVVYGAAVLAHSQQGGGGGGLGDSDSRLALGAGGGGRDLAHGGTQQGHCEGAGIVDELRDESGRPAGEGGRASLQHGRAPVADGEDAREHRLQLRLGPRDLLEAILLLLLLLGLLLLGLFLLLLLLLGLVGHPQTVEVAREAQRCLRRALREARDAATLGLAHVLELILLVRHGLLLAEHLGPKVGVVQVHRLALIALGREGGLRKGAAAEVVRRGLVGAGGRRGATVEDLLDRLRRELLNLLVVLLGEELLCAMLEERLDLGHLERDAGLAAATIESGRRLLAHVVVAAVANDRLLESKLLIGSIEQVHLVRLARHQAVDAHQLGLSDAMAARLGLQVVLRVPVGVVDDDGVGRRQVDADAARARAEEEEEGGRAFRTEAVDGLLPFVTGDRAIEPLVLEAAQLDVLLDEVQEHRELREDEDAVALLLQVRQQLVQEEHLAGGGDEVGEPCGVIGIVEALGLHDALDQERMVAAVAQLHRDVVERGPRAARLGATQQHRAVALEDGAVAALLEVGDLHADHRLLHRCQAEVDISLGAPEEVGAQHLGESAHLVRGLHVAILVNKLVEVGELFGLEEVEHRPELGDVVLQGRASQCELDGAAELTQCAQGLGLAVLQPVGFVDNQILPSDWLEGFGIASEHLVRRNAHVKLWEHL